MKRRHLRHDAESLVERLRDRRPEIAIGADLIAGFPTETDEHHASNLSIIRDLNIVHGVQHIWHPPAILPDWPSGDRRSRVVFILRDMEESDLRNALEFVTDKFAKAKVEGLKPAGLVN